MKSSHEGTKTRRTGRAEPLCAFVPSCENTSLTPRLRFPEFRGEPWKSEKLGVLGSFIGGGTPNKAVPEYWSGEIPWISSSDLQEDDVFDVSISRFITPEAISESATNLVRKGSVLFVSRVGTGKVAIAPVDLCTSQDFTNFVPRDLLNQYIAYYFTANKQALDSLGQGTSIKGFSMRDLEDFELGFPSIPEQRKLAECLSTLDDLIEAEGQKLDALKAHKKGLMQQLFPREGETLPRLRLLEFRHSPVWATKRGGDLFTNRKEKGEDGLPIYSVTINDGMVPRASFDRDFYDIEDPKGNRKVCKGDIAYNMMRMWQGAEGVAPENCMVSPAYVVLAPRVGVCSAFFAYLFKLPQSLHLLTATSRGLTKDRLRLYFDDFAQMRLRVPEVSEQQRIASCLSSLDDLIAAQREKLEALKTHKRGLMQQLFPSPNRKR